MAVSSTFGEDRFNDIAACFGHKEPLTTYYVQNIYIGYGVDCLSD